MVTGALKLRSAVPDDAEAFACIASDESVFGNLMRLPYSTAAQWSEWASKIGPEELLLVAERDGQVVGFAGLKAAAASPRRRHSRTLFIAVATTAQRQGIGNVLMQALLDAADRWMAVLRIELGVFVENEPAYRLYQKFGFEAEGIQRGFAFRDGRYQDVRLMARLHPRLLQQ
ncbi:GNAT family N-acetyltransferase [Chitinimonas sp. PSY-7]|uniref:GNAT family N-acetyltransferase n=1 Tax=Chitinimonas sp. PSY-7 TaxID=3459088 RepID=UPI00403FFE40